MASPRRVGKETSETRRRVLDAVEALMLESGYAAVSYRAVAAQAEVTPSLVQYYFPTLDDLLVATVQRRSDQSLRRLVQMLRSRPEHPLGVLWAFSNEETNAALTVEFSALGNHRQSVRTEITNHTKRLRAIQLEALSDLPALTGGPAGDIPPAAALFLLSGIPKLVRMEEDFDVDTGHQEIVDLVAAYIRSLEAPESRPQRAAT